MAVDDHAIDSLRHYFDAARDLKNQRKNNDIQSFLTAHPLKHGWLTGALLEQR